ncbi:DUF4205-containing protein [Aureococcus anophagefferens]|nr:DUF4205-containing protein [Aureococcus anophagefferens]
MSAADFAAMTGADEQAAAMYLEMAGGNMEIAVSIFFDGGGAPPAPPPPAAGDDEHAAATGSSGGGVPARGSTRVWRPSSSGASSSSASTATAPAACSPRRTRSRRPTASPTARRRCGGGGAMVAVCGIDGDAKVARWAGDVGGAVTHDVVAADVGAVEARVGAAFEARGGVALLVYSCVLSRGAARCLADAAVDGGGGPLIYGPFHLCTTELLNLLLFGVARGDVGAYGGGDAAKADWRGASPVGLLSADEVESGVPVADELKSPAGRAWIVHGGAARRLFFRASRRPADAPPPPLFELGDADPDEKWRCAACYKDRFRTFCFGENAAGSDACKFCGAARAGNHTIWRRFDDLPPAARRRVDRASGPKLLSILRALARRLRRGGRRLRPRGRRADRAGGVTCRS